MTYIPAPINDFLQKEVQLSVMKILQTKEDHHAIVAQGEWVFLFHSYSSIHRFLTDNLYSFADNQRTGSISPIPTIGSNDYVFKKVIVKGVAGEKSYLLIMFSDPVQHPLHGIYVGWAVPLEVPLKLLPDGVVP